ncbi:MAG: hypothetical protein R3Y43_00110 [Alphaproteobacteria bacterium]
MKKIIFALILGVVTLFGNVSEVKAQQGMAELFVGGGSGTTQVGLGGMFTDHFKGEFCYMAIWNYTTSGEQARAVEDGRNIIPVGSSILRGTYNTSYDDNFNFFIGGGVVWQSVYKPSRYDNYYYDDYYRRTPSSFGLNVTAGVEYTFWSGWFIRAQVDTFFVGEMPGYLEAGVGQSYGMPFFPTVSVGFKI